MGKPACHDRLPTFRCCQRSVAANVLLLPTFCCCQRSVAASILLLPTICCCQQSVAASLVVTEGAAELRAVCVRDLAAGHTTGWCHAGPPSWDLSVQNAA